MAVGCNHLTCDATEQTIKGKDYKRVPEHSAHGGRRWVSNLVSKGVTVQKKTACWYWFFTLRSYSCLLMKVFFILYLWTRSCKILNKDYFYTTAAWCLWTLSGKSCQGHQRAIILWGMWAVIMLWSSLFFLVCWTHKTSTVSSFSASCQQLLTLRDVAFCSTHSSSPFVSQQSDLVFMQSFFFSQPLSQTNILQFLIFTLQTQTDLQGATVSHRNTNKVSKSFYWFINLLGKDKIVFIYSINSYIKTTKCHLKNEVNQSLNEAGAEMKKWCCSQEFFCSL